MAAADASDDAVVAMVALVNLMLSGTLPRSLDLLLPRWQAVHDSHANDYDWEQSARDLPASFVREQLAGAAHDFVCFVCSRCFDATSAALPPLHL